MLFRELNHDICKTYVIGCMDSQKALLIDPVQSKLDRYIAMLAYFRLSLDTVLDTHTHADHRSATTELAADTGCKVARHVQAPQPNVDIHLKDGEELQVGDLRLTILHTPGHTPDSLSLYIEDRVLTGDCLLIGGTGRTDFAGGDAGTQFDSITEKLFQLPDETLIFPSHDYRGNTQSTIGYEKLHNPRIKNRTREQYIEVMDNLHLPLPEQIQEVLQINALESEDTEIDYPSIAELNKIMQLSPEAVHKQLNTEHPPLILDVREAHEYSGELGHIQGSKLIALGELPARHNEIEAYKNSRVITACRAGVRSTSAAAILTGLGFSRVSNLRGGMVEWNNQQLPVIQENH